MPQTRLVLEYQIVYAIPEELEELHLLLASAEKLGDEVKLADIRRLINDAEFQLSECKCTLEAMNQNDAG